MDNQEQKEKKNEKNFVVMILILIALIIIIFLLVRNLGFIDHKLQIPTGNEVYDNTRIPTGNVDIFDIIFQGNCNNNCNCCTNENDCDNSLLNGVEVFDDEVWYSQETPLHIFTNAAYYIADNKIAPTSTNSYQFVIRNNNSFNIQYSLDLYEENKYNINMKYRLKLNGIYVAGNNDEWLTYDELKQKNIGLAANTYDVYTLDWKWFESSNDTEVGTNVNSNYKLDLKITASAY